MKETVQLEMLSLSDFKNEELQKVLFDVEKQIDDSKNNIDNLDCYLAIASGLVCGMLDALLVKDFNLAEGRTFSREKVDGFVCGVAKKFGCEKDDITSCVSFLEKKFPMASDGNTPDFGGGLNHHLRDFAHHPTMIGMVFSLFTQFTGLSCGTDVTGKFIVVPVPKEKMYLIGKDVPHKIFNGVVVWFFHLVSDVAGSSSTAAKMGGTGIPGPIVSYAKMLSSLPVFNNGDAENSFSLFISKLFNGTLNAQYDSNGKIIRESVVRFDLRGELGMIYEFAQMSMPVIVNECVTRSFYFIRNFIDVVKTSKIASISDFDSIDFSRAVQFNTPEFKRMISISSGVFCAVDLTDALVKQNFLCVNVVGIGRFAIAIGSDCKELLKSRDVKRIKKAYEEVEKYIYRCDNYSLIEKLSLTPKQAEILYNVEYLKIWDDIDNNPKNVLGIKRIARLKKKWANEWKESIEKGFPGFVNDENAKINWYSKTELFDVLRREDPHGTWFKLMMYEAMLFTPYFSLNLIKGKDGKLVESKEYFELKVGDASYIETDGDDFLDKLFIDSSEDSFSYYTKGDVKKYHKEFNKLVRENSFSVSKIAGRGIIPVLAIGVFVGLTVASAGPIAVALVGSSFPGLSGAALTNACLAYLGGGAIAAGGYGMAGGTMVLAGGSAFLGLGVGSGISSTGISDKAVEQFEYDKKNYIYQACKLVAFANVVENPEITKAIKIECVEKRNKELSYIDELKTNLENSEDVKKCRRYIKEAEERVKVLDKVISKFV